MNDLENNHLDTESAINELSTLQDMLRWTVSRMHEHDIYFGHGTDNAWDEALILVTHALHLPVTVDAQWYNSKLTQAERQAVVQLVQLRIIERVPTPYITGVAWFYGLPFVVDERVLIPRSPVAEMLKQRFAPWWPVEKTTPKRIMDLCTGSGCIGIASATEFPQAEVELFDISFEALALAEENIERHQLQDRVTAFQSDLFAAATGKYDLIISNPPYVDAQDMSDLPKEYQYEPELALAAGSDGLDLVHIILQQAQQYLSDDGLLVVEVGNSWPALAAAYPNLPFVWPEFKQGGHGVFVLQARDLKQLN